MKYKRLRIYDQEYKKSWNIRIVDKGDNFGKGMCLLHKQKKPLVEFYDVDYGFEKDTDGYILGQLASRYYLDTILKAEWTTGLCLDGGVPEWSISKTTINKINNFLKVYKEKNK